MLKGLFEFYNLNAILLIPATQLHRKELNWSVGLKAVQELAGEFGEFIFCC